MGYWGSLIVVNSRQPLNEFSDFTHARQLELLQERGGNWRIWSLEGTDSLDDADLGRLVDLTGMPVLVGFVMDSDCLVLEGRTKNQDTWRSCLDRQSMAAYMAENGQVLEDWFLSPEEAADSAVAWARDAGFAVTREGLIEVFKERADPYVEDLFQKLLKRLGIPRE